MHSSYIETEFPEPYRPPNDNGYFSSAIELRMYVNQDAADISDVSGSSVVFLT